MSAASEPEPFETTLHWRVACECGDSEIGTVEGEPPSYREAWNAMDEWKKRHNAVKHPSRHKTFDAYSWTEDVRVVGDRSVIDGLPAAS